MSNGSVTRDNDKCPPFFILEELLITLYIKQLFLTTVNLNVYYSFYNIQKSNNIFRIYTRYSQNEFL